MNKLTFINDEFWFLTSSAAFQRANVYLPNTIGYKKIEFKKDLYIIISEITKEYLKDVSDAKHLFNIDKIRIETSRFQDILQNGQLNFGVCQKLLNLHLKYQWCLGAIPTPPHFPVDRRIQEKMRLVIKSWTSPEFDESDYREVIEHSKKLAQELKFNNIAEFELFLFRYEGDINILKKSLLKE